MARAPLISLVPRTVDLELYAGDGVMLRLRVAGADGTVYDLTGTMSAQIRAQRPDASILQAFAIDTTDAVDGVAVLSLTGAQTSSLLADADKITGVWDVQWTPADHEPFTLVQGKVSVILDVTRP